MEDVPRSGLKWHHVLAIMAVAIFYGSVEDATEGRPLLEHGLKALLWVAAALGEWIMTWRISGSPVPRRWSETLPVVGLLGLAVTQVLRAIVPEQIAVLLLLLLFAALVLWARVASRLQASASAPSALG